MKKDKKVVNINVLSRFFYPVKAGMELNILNTYSNFDPKQWKIVVHTTKDTPLKSGILSGFERIKGLSVKRYSRLTFPLRVLTSSLFLKDSILILHDLDISGELLLLVKVLLLKLVNKKNFTLVFSSHGLFNYGTNVYPGIRAWLRVYIQNSIGVSLINNCVDGIRAVSNAEKVGLVKAGVNENLIVVIGNGLEEEAFNDKQIYASKKVKRTTIELGKYIIQVGRIDRLKNFEVVIQALNNLPTNVKYLIVGGDSDLDYKQDLLELAKKFKVEKRVYFAGEVHGVDKYYLIKNSFVMVHLAKTEGFGNSVHEALSQGVICIVSKNTALTELVTNNVNGFHLLSSDYIGLQKRIKSILKSDKSRWVKNMRNLNQAQYQKHSWKDTATDMQEFYLSTALKRKKNYRRYLFEKSFRYKFNNS